MPVNVNGRYVKRVYARYIAFVYITFLPLKTRHAVINKKYSPIFGGPQMSYILVQELPLPKLIRPPKVHIKHIINKHWYDHTV